MTIPPRSSVVVRPVRLADGDELRRTCWPQRSSENITDLLHRSQQLATNRRGLGVVSLHEGVLCGFGLLTVWPRAAEISDLIVNPTHRNQGVGSAIIAYLTGTARRLRVETLEIGAAMTNPRAMALYRRLGFVDDRVIEIDLGNDPEPVLFLMKKLPVSDP